MESLCRAAYVEARSAELLFRHKVIACLRDEGLLSDQRIELLLSWHHTGFSVHNTVTVEPGVTAGTVPTAWDPMDFLARLRMHIPQPRLHTIPSLSSRRVTWRLPARQGDRIEGAA